jgi:hypothetical protein
MAMEIVVRDQPNSVSRGTMRMLGVARVAAEISRQMKVTPRMVQA